MDFTWPRIFRNSKQKKNIKHFSKLIPLIPSYVLVFRPQFIVDFCLLVLIRIFFTTFKNTKKKIVENKKLVPWIRPIIPRVCLFLSPYFLIYSFVSWNCEWDIEKTPLYVVFESAIGCSVAWILEFFGWCSCEKANSSMQIHNISSSSNKHIEISF